MNDDVVICLHGFLGSPASWVRVAAAVRGLGVTVEAPWLPGHGPDPRNTDARSFDEVIGRLGRELAGRRAIVFGYSLGGRLALALAAAFPDRVRAVLAIGASTGIEAEDERARRVAWEAGLVQDLQARGLEAFVDAWQALPLFATQAMLPAEVLAAQRRARLGHDPAAIAWALSELGAGSMPPLLPRLVESGGPALFVVGALDDRALDVARRAMGVLPRAEVAVVPGAGHNLLLEAPSTVVELAIDFVRAHVPRTAHVEAEAP
jgi:2-succinyl-6-hydroxy-2,4-cyclohexadiene-1-carboxylate synthase